MKLLIATDGSKYSEAAVKSVANRPWPTGTEMKVLTVMEIIPTNLMVGGEFAFDLSSYQQRLQNILTEVAETAAQSLSAAGHSNVSTLVREGAVAEAIINEAQEWGADLIIMGTHGRQGLSLFLMGSVAQRVATHAHCSVELIRLPPPAQTEPAPAQA